ncbi:MAG: lipopolysaccharide heptosyltransferase II [Ktedonobacterales bacterium]|nr:lipopolysaccharide heptosyltransferase II [Ktedonobacterales bacterium]
MTSPPPRDAPGIAAASDPDYDTRPPFEGRLRGALARAIKPVAQRGLRMALGMVGYMTRGQAGTPPPLVPGDPRIRRILVVRVDLLGDTVLSTPAVRALRRGYPSARIDMLVQPAMTGVLRGDPDLADVIGYNPHIWRSPSAWFQPRTWIAGYAMLRRLRGKHFDLAISVSGDIGSILTRLTNAQRRVGYTGEAYRGFLTDPVPGARYRAHQHEVRYVLRLAEAAGGIAAPEDARPWLRVDAEARRQVTALLRQGRHQLDVPGPVITMHAGARNGQAKRWPPAHLAALADQLVEELGALVVLTGAPHEKPLADEVARLAHVPLLNLAGGTTIPQLVALLAESAVVVSGDSGPMHIACAVGARVVALHGPTDPDLSGPTAPDAIVLRHRLWCAPCYDASATAECRFGNPVCMKALAPRMVFAAVRRQLQRHERQEAAMPNQDEMYVAAAPHP